jgi:hypothetical protein
MGPLTHRRLSLRESSLIVVTPHCEEGLLSRSERQRGRRLRPLDNARLPKRARGICCQIRGWRRSERNSACPSGSKKQQLPAAFHCIAGVVVSDS